MLHVAVSKVKMSGSEKKKQTVTQPTKVLVCYYDFSYTRCITTCRKFHVVHVDVQNNVSGMYKESVLHVFSFLIRPTDFLLFLLLSPFSITRLYLFVWVNCEYINESFAFIPG